MLNMKIKYIKPTMEIVQIKGKQRFLAGSVEGFQATMSGYDTADDENEGLSQ
jgi:hypothetical protein